jgi:uncharacterized membrane protein YccC
MFQVVILFYPTLLLLVGMILLGEPRRSRTDRGSGWFMAWAVAGGLFMLSFMSGFSIGLLLLPAAAALLLFVAWRCPHEPERTGFALGVGLVFLLIAFLNHAERDGPDATLWLLAGVVLSAAGIATYVLADRPQRA